jgi:transposase-like protein
MRQRRQFSAEFKARVVLDVLSGQKRAAEVCREHQLKPDLLSRWKADFVTQAANVFQGDERSQRAEQRIAELERLVGRLTLELEVAKKLCCSQSGAATSGERAVARRVPARRDLRRAGVVAQQRLRTGAVRPGT